MKLYVGTEGAMLRIQKMVTVLAFARTIIIYVSASLQLHLQKATVYVNKRFRSLQTHFSLLEKFSSHYFA